MRTVYLHIGMHRTATSSIQEFLNGNRKGLLAQGYLYPFGQRHLRQFNELFGGLETSESLAKTLNMRADKKEQNVHSIILSDEDVCTRKDLSLLGELRADFNVKVVYSLRRQDLWLESWYLQNIKWQWDEDLCHATFDEFLERRHQFFWLDFKEFVTHLENVFGRENLLLSVFESSQMPQGPIRTFMEAVGLRESEDLVEPPKKNSSLGLVMSEFIRNLPLNEAPGPVRAKLERACINLDAQMPKAKGNRLLDAQNRKEILKSYADGNGYIAKRFFGRRALFNDPLPNDNDTVGRMELPQDSQVLMRQIISPFVRELIALYADEDLQS